MLIILSSTIDCLSVTLMGSTVKSDLLVLMLSFPNYVICWIYLINQSAGFAFLFFDGLLWSYHLKY